LDIPETWHHEYTISRRSANGIPVPCKETIIMQRVK